MSSVRAAVPATALAFLVSLAACEPAPPGGRTAESAADRSVPSLDTVPALVILDTIPGAEPKLLRPTGATVLSNGNLVVVDQWGASVRFFDPSGELFRTVGRQGQGPGEFTGPNWLGRCGPEEVFVWDYMQGQMSVIDSAGTIVREYAPAKNPGTMRCSREGRFAVFGQPEYPVNMNMRNMYTMELTAPVRFEDAEGDSMGGVGIIPMGETWILGRLTEFAITSDRLYVARADTTSADVYDLDGGRLGSIPLTIEPREPTEANVEKWLDRQWEKIQADTEYRRRGKEMTRKNSKVPEHLPPCTALAVDPAGVLWVVLSSPGDGETRFHLVDPDGPVLGELRIPRDFELYEVGRDYVLGRIYDTNDVPGIALYRITRGLP